MSEFTFLLTLKTTQWQFPRLDEKYMLYHDKATWETGEEMQIFFLRLLLSLEEKLPFEAILTPVT